MKYKKNIILSCLLITFFAQSIFALDYGDSAPKITVSKWLKNKPEQYLKNMKEDKNDSIVVLCIWATWSETTNNIFNFLNTEVGVYSKENIVFIALSKENERIVDRFVRSFGDIRFSVAVDDKSKTYDKYMINTDGVPMFFVIDKDNDLIWQGSPFELDRVLSRVVTNTFNNEQEKQIEKVRDDLQKTIQYLNFDKQAELAERILKIDPLDQMAINIIVDDYIRKNQLEKSIKYMLGKIKESNYNKFIARALYFNLLTVYQGMNDELGHKYLKETTKRFFVAFKNDPDALNSYCIALVTSMPMEIVPLKETYEMINQAIDTLKKLHPEDKENLGLFYRTLAKTYYMIGKPQKAVETQEESVKLLKAAKNSSDLTTLIEQGELLTKHYKIIQKLQATLK